MTTFTAGTYYIGDPCYVLGKNHEQWIKLLERTNYLSDGDFEYKGENCHASGTAYGDGEYYDNFCRSYAVDAGLLSIIPVSVLTKKALKAISKIAQIVEFSKDFEVDSSDGIFVFGHVKINTKDDSDDEENDI